VAAHDPALAVFGGDDGLDVIRRLVPRAARLLRPDGLLGVEHDDTHTAAMADLLAESFTEITTHADLAGRPRFSTARRRP
jgi:release factor glutamine methyltransferase